MQCRKNKFSKLELYSETSPNHNITLDKTESKLDHSTNVWLDEVNMKSDNVPAVTTERSPDSMTQKTVNYLQASPDSVMQWIYITKKCSVLGAQVSARVMNTFPWYLTYATCVISQTEQNVELTVNAPFLLFN